MTVLLDHCVPQDLRHQFPDGCEVHTADYVGWANYNDTELLRAAEGEYDLFVTLDSSLKDQQHLDGWAIGVIVLGVHPATPDYLESVMPKVREITREVADREEVAVIRGAEES